MFRRAILDRVITDQQAGNYKTAGNYKLTPLTV